MGFIRLRANILQLASIIMVAALIAVIISLSSGAAESKKEMNEVAPALVRMFSNDK